MSMLFAWTASCILDMQIPRRIPIMAGSRVVGGVEGGEFKKTAKASRHFLRQPPAIALDLEALRQAEMLGASIVVVAEQESGRSYRASISQILSLGFFIDRGFGRQIVLPLTRWRVDGAPVQLGFGWDI